jgi:hypothetical protein
MYSQSFKFCLVFTSKAQNQIDALSLKDRKQYDKAFQNLAKLGPSYRSLRTHRYHHKGCNIWGSSASMAKRFYWYYKAEKIIAITNLDSH